MTKPRIAVKTRSIDCTQIKTLLEARRREIKSELRAKVRGFRTYGQTHGHRVDEVDQVSEVEIDQDVELALVEMKSDTLVKIDEALERIERGSYGLCVQCGDEISSARLRALPFAERCKDCEEERAQAAQLNG